MSDLNLTALPANDAVADAFAVYATDLLSATRLFSGLRRDLVAEIAAMAQMRDFPAGEVLFEKGDVGDVMYVLLSGMVKVYVTNESGEEMVLVDLRPCESFGELALLDGEPRSASVQTLEPCTVMTLDRSDLIGAMHRNSDLMEALLRNLGSMVRRLTEHTTDLVFLDLHERVSKLLVGLMQERGEHTPDGTLLDLTVTLSELASVVGGSAETVQEVIQSFAQLGYLELQEKHILVRDATRLHDAVSAGLSWAVLAQQAFKDPLTGLANRTRFDERVSTALTQNALKQRPTAVLIVDLDDFKSINDSLGHQAGDEVLEIVAESLSRCIRQPDTAARLGGDEFGLVITDIDSADVATAVARRVVRALDRSLNLKTGTVHTSASVGVAVAGPHETITVPELVARADAAMYEAKRAGKHRFMVHGGSSPQRADD